MMCDKPNTQPITSSCSSNPRSTHSAAVWANKLRASVTASAGFKGTYNYMAPDFLSEGSEFRGDELSDVFSMGATLFAMLSGQAPFTGSSLMKVIMNTAQEAHTPLEIIAAYVCEQSIFQKGKRVFADGEIGGKGGVYGVYLVMWMNKITTISGMHDDVGKL